MLSTGSVTGTSAGTSSGLIQAWPQLTTSALSSTQAETETPVLEETGSGRACKVPGRQEALSESKCY